MIKRILRSIRKQPRVIRDNIALGIAVVFTGAVVSTWLYQAPARNAEYEVTPSATADKSPGFSKLLEGINTQVAAVKESVLEIVATTTDSEMDTETPSQNENKDFSTTTSPFIMPDEYMPPAREVRITAVETSTTSSTTPADAPPVE